MYEITPWKDGEFNISVPVRDLTNRESFSREINTIRGGGGALNAGYDVVEAAMIVANILGQHRFVYGKDFIFKTSVDGGILLGFTEYEALMSALKCIGRAIAEQKAVDS